LKQYAAETGKGIEGFTRRAVDMLGAYHWPGNVRELRNVIERAVVIARGRMIGARELTFLNPKADVCTDISDNSTLSLADMEIKHIRASLDNCGWNISRTARQLGIDRGTLSRKIQRYGIKRS